MFLAKKNIIMQVIPVVIKIIVICLNERFFIRFVAFGY